MLGHIVADLLGAGELLVTYVRVENTIGSVLVDLKADPQRQMEDT